MPRLLLLVALLVMTAGCGAATLSSSCPRSRHDAYAGAEFVSVDWLGLGDRYVARVLLQSGELSHVYYANQEREWVSSERVEGISAPALQGQGVSVWTPRGPMWGTVEDVAPGSPERGTLVRVSFASGGDGWYGLDQLYQIGVAAEHASPPANDDAAEEAAALPRRRAVDTAGLAVGDRILCSPPAEAGEHYVWAAEVLTLGEALQVRYLGDNTLGEVTRDDVVHIFVRPGEIVAGARVWLEGATPLGTVIAVLDGRLRVSAHGGELLVPRERVVAIVPPPSREELVPGANVTVLWEGHTLYSGTLVRLEDEQAIVDWHAPGYDPSGVAITDVVDVWEARTP